MVNKTLFNKEKQRKTFLEKIKKIILKNISIEKKIMYNMDRNSYIKLILK